MRSLLYCVVITATTIALSYEAVLAQECVDLARVMARESERFADRNQVELLHTANLCSAQYESASSEQRAQIEASYGLLSGGLSGSAQQIRTMQQSICGNRYGREWWDQITSREIQRVSQTGADVVRACLDQRSFRLVGLRIQDEAITAAFRYGGSGETIINGVILTPKEIAQCSVLYNGSTQGNLERIVGTRLRSGDTLTLDCHRLSESIGTDRRNYKGGIIGVATVTEVAQFPLISYSVPALPEPVADSLSKQIGELKATIRNLQNSLDEAKLNINNLTNTVKDTGAPHLADELEPWNNEPEHWVHADCKPGEVMVGMELQISNSFHLPESPFPDHALRVLRKVQARCAPKNAEAKPK